MSEANNHTIDQTNYQRTKDYFLPPSIRPIKNVPDLLKENREFAMNLAQKSMEQFVALSEYFGVPLMDLVLSSLPENCRSLEADGVRERAAAKTYWDLGGSVGLAEICNSTMASRGATLRFVAQHYRKHGIARDPLIERIFSMDLSTDDPNEEKETDFSGAEVKDSETEDAEKDECT